MSMLWTLLAAAQLPIIDMHLHASTPDAFGGPQTVCTNTGNVEFPPIDPANEMTVQKAAVCAHSLMSARDEADNARRTGAWMKRRNIYGMLAATRSTLADSAAVASRWSAEAPGRYWIGFDFNDGGLPPIEQLEPLVRAGRIALFAEIAPQYDGGKVTDAKFEPYFALAERLDVPVAIHLGEGPPGGATVVPGSKYDPSAGRPFDLEPLLRRHPKLRVYVMHYGSPMIDEMIAMLYAHPNLYVDVAQNDWGFPRAHFYGQLRRLVDAGFAKRIMFGSDQMIWPDTIGVAIDTIEQVPFLSRAQKRDIFYNNAARFLRLDERTRAQHRAGTPAVAH